MRLLSPKLETHMRAQESQRYLLFGLKRTPPCDFCLLQQRDSDAVHLPNSMLPFNSSPLFLVPADFGGEVSQYCKPVGGKRVTELSV